LICLIRVTKRVRRRRIRLGERAESRLWLKLKLGYKLPAEAYLYKYNLLCYQIREDNTKSQNNNDIETIVGKEQ
jgi:hypothetical protein